MIHFEINGKRVKSGNIGDTLMQAALESIEAQIRRIIGTIRDPETGEFPTVVMRGDSLENLHMHVEGSPELIALVRERMGKEEDAVNAEEPARSVPSAFLSYASEDAELAERIATALQAHGIETWWDKWCIATGDSLRQKIDEGLGNCTHFLVLLTPQSIGKPWVNQEIDAGLVRKLSDKCRFLPIRHKLPPEDLSPLLSGMLAPEIGADEDITQLISDIHGITRKPKLGPAPHTQATEATTRTGYSAAANMVARYFVEQTKHGTFADPRVDIETLAQGTSLNINDAKDALYELSAFFKDTSIHSLVKPSLFTEFDRYWKPWDPRSDALKLAADIMNDPEFPAASRQIAERYSWEPRRLNPAVNYLIERGLAKRYEVMGEPQFVQHRVIGKIDELRRFLKNRP